MENKKSLHFKIPLTLITLGFCGLLINVIAEPPMKEILYHTYSTIPITGSLAYLFIYLIWGDIDW